jgi:predicted dehydrogenase
MNTVRIGVIGLGNMGSHHTRYLAAGGVDGAKLGAICDIEPAKLDGMAAVAGNAPRFGSATELIKSGSCDAVIIATRKLNDAAARHPNLKFGIMYNQRTNGLYQKIRELVADGELGEITRITWLVTDWFRTWTYYASGGWRATWAGEGGGVLINQCPHNFDLIQWIPGMVPSRVTAVASLGKTHPIEVEDEVSAIFEYPNGAIGHFITTTGEAPGTNRLEIAGDRGKIVAEHGKILFKRARTSVKNLRETSPLSFTNVETWDIDVPYKPGPADEHKTITTNFVSAILRGTPLLSPGVEGVRGLEIGNAILMSGMTRKPVDLPVDGEAYDQLIKDLTAKHGGSKKLATKDLGPVDLAGSHSRT